MTAVFLSTFDKKKGRSEREDLFSGSYDECKAFFEKRLDEERAANGNEHYIRSYPSSHNSIEAIWSLSRLVLQNWKQEPDLGDV